MAYKFLMAASASNKAVHQAPIGGSGELNYPLQSNVLSQHCPPRKGDSTVFEFLAVIAN